MGVIKIEGLKELQKQLEQYDAIHTVQSNNNAWEEARKRAYQDINKTVAAHNDQIVDKQDSAITKQAATTSAVPSLKL